MGQYYYIVNLDKQEYLHPHKLGDGLKLMEFACNSPGTMTALALLLAEGNGRGGGDHPSSHTLIGSWARDRIVVAGDYADPEEDTKENIHEIAGNEYRDISEEVKEVMLEDKYVKEMMSPPWQ